MNADLAAGGANECRFNGLEGGGVNADLVTGVGGVQFWWLAGMNADFVARREECMQI